MRRRTRWALGSAVGLMVALSMFVVPAMGDGPVLGETGVLHLHLNADGDRFVYDPANSGADLTQTLSETQCKLAGGGDSLVSVIGSGQSSKHPFAGLKDHRIGVGQKYEGTGEPCARINK
ncbi:MAG: hypothetical protein WCA93_05750, partial [Acidimicrobiia bacterium]